MAYVSRSACSRYWLEVNVVDSRCRPSVEVVSTPSVLLPEVSIGVALHPAASVSL